MAALSFDEQTSQRILRTYMTEDVVEQPRQVRAVLNLQPGEAVLDIGSGPGVLAAEMAIEVGSSGPVVGVEPSADMRVIAGGSAADVEFVDGDATALPFDDATFDAATATQVYEYMSDISATLAEARRVLRPGGRLLVLDTDWDSIVWHCRDDARMRRPRGVGRAPRRCVPAPALAPPAERTRVPAGTRQRAAHTQRRLTHGYIQRWADWLPG